jgi:geranylgeranyl diphosphate synthase type I
LGSGQGQPTTRRGLPSFFSRYQSTIDGALREELQGRELSLYETHRYYMGWTDTAGVPSDGGGGKRLRPTLTLLACESAGGEIEKALPVAIALEYVHNFSLIHDDLEDGDRFRHHRPTVWAVWGEAIAIVSGNAMLKVADRAAMRLAERGVGLEVSLEAQRALTTGYLRMMEGQYLDIEFESRPSISVQEYLDMIERKTGALIEAAIYLGALLGRPAGAGRELADGFRMVGHDLGRIFQIRDDILGVWGGAETGKPVGADIQRKKKALPAVHALSQSVGASKKRLAEIFALEEITGSDVEDVLEIMAAMGTQEFCQSMAAERWQRARNVLQSLRIPADAHREFEELGEFLLVRDS